MRNIMPRIAYPPENIVEKYVIERITREGCLRRAAPAATHPPQKSRGIFKYDSTQERLDGISRYVWRMVAFMISPISEHHCMPITASFWLEGFEKETKMWDPLVDKIVDMVPKSEWAGIRRWSELI